ncbi:MAG TPA: hypothetical protein VLA62_07060, partial [Solirubrobacterales bacterium]|nr:hypothetical protein [Solirubrobacterales bacterium]
MLQFLKRFQPVAPRVVSFSLRAPPSHEATPRTIPRSLPLFRLELVQARGHGRLQRRVRRHVGDVGQL